jgi:hypothetical protein
LLEFGLYHDQLLFYFKFFPREQICIQLDDDYVADPAGTFPAIFAFLGVDAAFVPDASKRHPEARSPRRPGLTLSLQEIGLWLAARKLTPRAFLPVARRLAFQPRGPSHDERPGPAISREFTTPRISIESQGSSDAI